LDKKEARNRAQTIRDRIPLREKKLLDAAILKNLFTWDIYQKAQYIFCYVSFRSEINTIPIIERMLKNNKVVTVPRINLKTCTMRAFIITDFIKNLRPGEYGILEPLPSCQEADYSKIDLIISPGLAFTIKGERLGYGGGFYDRFLQKNTGVPNCALSYDRLVIGHLPVKNSDVPVDYLITESRLIRTHKEKK
jgi:5-formyltetrahydrofolate cyclo-ligase